MLKYTLKRLLYMVLTLFIVITITFFLIHAIPGDPLSSLARNLPAQVKENFYAKYGLNKSVPEQYVMFLKIFAVEILRVIKVSWTRCC